MILQMFDWFYVTKTKIVICQTKISEYRQFSVNFVAVKKATNFGMFLQ